MYVAAGYVLTTWILAEKPRLVDGRVELSTRPGLGLVWDADDVKRWTVTA